MSDVIVALRGIHQSFRQGETRIKVLNGAQLTLQRGEVVALAAPSGAGKSTLLHIAGLLERPSRGEVVIAGRRASHLGDRQRTELRSRTLGFVYQAHQLLAEFTALENVALPMLIAGRRHGEATKDARRLLSSLGLEHRLRHLPAQMSGGEQQRVAIARAIANRPLALFADEPTGNLDEDTAHDVFGVLLEAISTSGAAALLATHNPTLAARMHRVLGIEKGVVVEHRGKATLAPEKAPSRGKKTKT